MKIGFLAGVSFHRDLNLFVWQPRGVLDEPHVEQLLVTLERVEDEAERPFDRFTDLSQVDLVDLNLDYVFRVSLYRRILYVNRTPVKSAMYVVDRATAEVAVMHAKGTAETPLQVRVYLQKTHAARWLGVSVRDLEVDR